MKLWQRYLLSKIAQTFAFLLFSLFLLFCLVDLSMHGVRFASGKATLLATLLYYVQLFSSHLELFFPLAFLLTSLKVLFDFNSGRELVALQMAGLSKKRLLIPFFLFSFFLTLISYLNYQFIAPQAEAFADHFRLAHDKKTKKERERVSTFSLEDGTELIYQSFDPVSKKFFDLFWVKNPNDIWHIKYLEGQQARFVDHLTRNREGRFEKTESFEELALPGLLIPEEALLEHFTPFENRPLLTLLQQTRSQTSNRPLLLSQLGYKLALPLLSPLLLLCISPLALRFSRHTGTFLLVTCSLFALIALKTLLEGMLILAENQVLPPFLAIWGPFVLLLCLRIPPFLRL